ncbi:hypothetical protein SLE2022_292810 [Rubroshorea leprosula]
MDGELSVDFNALEDLIQPLLIAANSSTLEEALESLIEVSRTSVGCADLPSRKIIPTVLKLAESSHNPSGRHHLSLCLKLLRNLCAGEISNQDAFIKYNGVWILSTVLRSLASVSDPDYGVIRAGLQVVANVSLAGEEHQLVIWNKFFPDEFVVLARVQSRETIDPLCMVIYACCDENPELVAKLCSVPGLLILVEIVHTIFTVGFQEDWFKLLLSRICVENILFPVLFLTLGKVGASQDSGEAGSSFDPFSPEQASLLRVTSEIVNERIEEIIVPNDLALCVLEIFKKSAGVVDFSTREKSGLPTGSTATDVLGYSLTILRDICARDGSRDKGEDSMDAVSMLLSSGLIELMLSLLQDLEPPPIIRKAMKQGENQDGTSLSLLKLCPYRGFRRDLVAVIGNCAYRRKHVQDKIRQENGVLLLVQQCVTDEDNPFLREWGIWSVRNLLEGNAENQQMVADFELQGSIDVPELARLGLRVEVDQETRRAKLVNVPGK